jgi:hypothetical protein
MASGTTKLYHQMSPAEQLAERIARNRGIAERAAATVSAPDKKPGKGSGKQKPSRTVLDQFQEIKRIQGIDAAAEFVRDRKK